MPPYHSWLYVRDRSGDAHEIINSARTAAYLANPSLAIEGIAPCQPFTGMQCATYPYEPYLGPEVRGYVVLPGTSGNYLSAPDAAAIDITSDITIIAKIAPTLWTGSLKTIVGKWATAANLSYMLQLDTNGKLLFSWTSDGSSVLSALSTVVVPGVVAATPHWVAVAFDVNNGAAGRTARFYHSTDGLNFTIIGAPVTTATATSLFSGSSSLFIGAQTSSTNLFTGRIYDVSVRAGINATTFGPGGVEKFHISGHEITNTAAATYTATTGQTVTVNKSGSPTTSLVARIDCGSWTALTFNTPTVDLAPWYNSNYPQSADALGFYVEEWTGLDDGHLTRPTTPWGGYGGGASLGGISATGRTMKVNVFLFGKTEMAVEYLFRWLAATLTGVCGTCATDSILTRRFCGSTVNLWDGVAEMRNVGLIEGLKWESDIAQQASCYLRRASFTLMAGDPCMYAQETTVGADGGDITAANLTACFAASVPNPNRAFCRPACSEVDSTCRTTRAFSVNPMAAMAPIVTWTNSMTQYSFPFRAICYADPNSVGASNPCGLPILGELYVRALPPGSALRWDVVGRNVEFRDPSTGGWADGWAYIEPNDPPEKRFFALPCGRGHVVMEPGSLCATFVSGTTWTLDGVTFNPPTYPTVAVSMGERYSCV